MSDKYIKIIFKKLNQDSEAQLATKEYSPKGSKKRLIFCSGFMSDMNGNKANMILDWAINNNVSATLFDYSGCGSSTGDFSKSSIKTWCNDLISLISLYNEDIILVGSSMGGWISTYCATINEKIKKLILIAPAPDFTEWGLRQKLSNDDYKNLKLNNYTYLKSEYSDHPYIVHRFLIEDSKELCLLNSKINFAGKVEIIHGMQDSSVPWKLSIELAELFTSDKINITLVKNGDHRLSDPHSLQLLEQILYRTIFE